MNPAPTPRQHNFDILIIGSGLAGLTAALLLAPGTRGLSLLLFAAYGALMVRMIAHFRRSGASLGTAVTAALFGIIAKFANFIGLIRFFRHQLTGKTVLVEYK